MWLATGLAALGGLIWSFGILGKRIGVQGAPDHAKGVRATCTICVYTLTTLIPPLMTLAVADKELVRSTFNNTAWTRRIPGILSCGAMSGLGGVLGTTAFAWSAGANSAVISMVENGMYTMAGAILIAVVFQEHPPYQEYIAGALIITGILVAQSTAKHGSGANTKGVHSNARCGEEKNIVADVSSPVAHIEMSSRSHASAAGEGEHSDDDHVGPQSMVVGASFEVAECRHGINTSHREIVLQSVDALDEGPPLRKRALVLAIFGGMCWGFGPLGKKIGVASAPAGLKQIWTTCTYLVYIACTCVVPLCGLAFSNADLRAEALRDGKFRLLLLGTMACGLLASCGGMVSTLAFAQGAEHSAIVSVMENGVYTVAGALLITLIFKERPSKRQIAGAALVVAGLLVSAAR